MKLLILPLLLAALSSLSEGSSRLPRETCDYNYMGDLVREMNSRRLTHQANNLELIVTTDYELSEYAQRKAEFFAGHGADPPPPNRWFSAFHKTVEPNRKDSPFEVVYEMYSEGRDYPYYCSEPPSESERQKYAHFTQMLWVASGKVTIGCDDDYTGRRHLVAVFWDEPGNQIGFYADNVQPTDGRPCAARANATAGRN